MKNEDLEKFAHSTIVQLQEVDDYQCISPTLKMSHSKFQTSSRN